MENINSLSDILRPDDFIATIDLKDAYFTVPIHSAYSKFLRFFWRGVVWCGVVWCGVVWCGVVWCGVVWCGVVWCGVVCCMNL